MRFLGRFAVAQLASRQVAVLATLVREPKIGDDVAFGSCLGKIDIVTRYAFQGGAFCGDQVRVWFAPLVYETFSWSELTWGRGLWEAKRDPP
jgi:hypothetical protein